MLRPDDPLVLLQHQGLTNLRGKTGLAMLRYRSGPIVAVIDPDRAGHTLRDVTGIPRDVPVVGSMPEALIHGPSVAVVGLAPSGGRLPEDLRGDLLEGLRAGLSVASGLHTRIGEDEELMSQLRPGRWVWDLRQEPPDLVVGSGLAAGLACRRVLTVGSDMSVGKMSTCLELQAAAKRRGVDARFVGTGQAGILISGEGVPLDAVRVDYAAGAIEKAVLRAGAQAGPEAIVLVEGQGSVCHPGSSATLPLIRGCQPTDLLLVHRAGQSSLCHLPHFPLPPLSHLISVLESMAALARPMGTPVPPPRVVALALNTSGLRDDVAAAAMEEAASETGLPCVDPVRRGADELLDLLTAGSRI
jgi:uncharacterized NAD-dependent epimerase/dehydratase family protein